MHAEQEKLNETFLTTFRNFVPNDGFSRMPDGGYRNQSTRMLFFGWQAAIDSAYRIRERGQLLQDLTEQHVLLPKTPTPLMLAAFNLAGIPNPRDQVCHSELFRRAFENSEAQKFRNEAKSFLTGKDFVSEKNGEHTSDFMYAFTGWQVARSGLNPEFVAVSEWITYDAVGLRESINASDAFIRVLKDYTNQMILSGKV
jgi:hypothetical protein